MQRRYVLLREGVRNSIIADDLDTRGQIENTIVYPGARVADSAVIRNSILLPGAVVGAGQLLEQTIVLEPEIPGQASPSDVIRV
jgi:glucose-1-phosphate adenylyltransferase